MTYASSRIIEMDKYLRIPIITGIKTKKIGEEWIKTKDYKINTTLDPTKLETGLPPSGWSLTNCKNPQNYDECLPFPWPEKYTKKGQNFNPWAFVINIKMLINYGKSKNQLPEVKPMIDYLVDLSTKYSTISGKTRFVVYLFDKKYKTLSVKSGHVSGYGNGRVLEGLSYIYQAYKEPKYLELANSYLNAYLEIRQGDEIAEPWFSYLTNEDYLWFEELPTSELKKTHILNGHIQALFGLFYFYKYTGDETALNLLKAGILTVHRYATTFRFPGTINRYDLVYKHPDYGPERTISQQQMLYLMTDEPYFKELYDTFLTDMKQVKEQ